jgi:hypothetical protein
MTGEDTVLLALVSWGRIFFWRGGNEAIALFFLRRVRDPSCSIRAAKK